jgi:hypothetical protein
LILEAKAKVRRKFCHENENGPPKINPVIWEDKNAKSITAKTLIPNWSIKGLIVEGFLEISFSISRLINQTEKVKININKNNGIGSIDTANSRSPSKKKMFRKEYNPSIPANQ